MATRPPEDDDPPEAITFGIAALTPRLENAELRYPARPDEIVRAVGDTSIPADPAGNTLDLETALDRTEETSFGSERELLDALHPVFEQHRRSTSVSLLGRLRSLF